MTVPLMLLISYGLFPRSTLKLLEWTGNGIAIAVLAAWVISLSF